MAYIGRQLVRGTNRVLDDISGSFNGSTTTFNLTVDSSASPPGSQNQLWISIGGVFQEPGTDFTVADAQITFTTAPASTLGFWGMIQGDVTDGVAPSDASVSPAKIASEGDFAFPADVRFKDADGSHYVGLQAPTTVSSNLVWTLPAADGSANQYLKTNGSGVLGWASDTQSNLLDEDNMSSNSATQPASQQSIKAYADTKAVLTGSTNNTITTVTGAHAIQGEANLTYDGSHLSIATDAHGEGIKLTASGSTYNGITFDANRSGADEYMGSLEAKWNGSLVSFISFETGTDTTNKDDGLIAFSTRASGESIGERMRIGPSGQLLIGHTAVIGHSGIDGFLQITGTTSDNSSITQSRFSNDAWCPFITMAKSRNGAKGSHTVVQNGDYLGYINFAGSDGTDFDNSAAYIAVRVDGTPGTDDLPGRLIFATTPDNANSATIRLVIGSDGSATHTAVPASNGNAGFVLDTDSTSNMQSMLFKAGGENRAQLLMQRVAGDGGYACFQIAQTDNSNTLLNVWSTTPSSSGDTTPDLTIYGNVKFNSAGAGISFDPHDASASDPGSDSNLLDDYEEGTFTPTFAKASGTAPTVTYEIQEGQYTKIGNRVCFHLLVATDAFAYIDSGSLVIDGLPFNGLAGDGGWCPVPVLCQNTNVPIHVGLVSAGNDIIYLYKWSSESDGDITNVSASDLTQGSVANQNYVRISGTYQSA